MQHTYGGNETQYFGCKAPREETTWGDLGRDRTTIKMDLREICGLDSADSGSVVVHVLLFGGAQLQQNIK
jgi:hypothetical protein